MKISGYFAYIIPKMYIEMFMEYMENFIYGLM
jgi:hypothetical protein